MNKTETDLHSKLDGMFRFVADIRFDGEPDATELKKIIQKNYEWFNEHYILKSEAISRKDAVSKSEVERIIDYSPKTQLEDSENQDTYHEGYEQCLQDMKDLLTEVDKPNKE